LHAQVKGEEKSTQYSVSLPLRTNSFINKEAGLEPIMETIKVKVPELQINEQHLILIL
jgi:hypothetical protein